MEEASAVLLDETYEFSAPSFFDFINGETEEEMQNAELWFKSALSYAPSPFMVKIKTGRSIQLDTLCDFSQADQLTKMPESLTSTLPSKMAESSSSKPDENQSRCESSLTTATVGQNMKATVMDGDDGSISVNEVPPGIESTEVNTGSISQEKSSTEYGVRICEAVSDSIVPDEANTNVSTPVVSSSRSQVIHELKETRTAKRMTSSAKNPSTSKKMPNHSQQSHVKSSKPTSVKSEAKYVKKSVETANMVRENQAIKRQKLDGGQTRQILNPKPTNLAHKSRQGVIAVPRESSSKEPLEQRKIYVREPAAPSVPFISTAEMMKKFQSCTRGMSLPKGSTLDAGSSVQGKPQLTLTRPKEPDFETSQRIRPTRVKSSTELEEELMAKMPKFKARPLNKKIFEAPALPAQKKSIPQPPEFQEFHLKTMERANKNAEVSSISSETSRRSTKWRTQLTEPKTPVLQTSLRARPLSVKSSLEIEQEELEKIPKFKARPLNKKIFESKGDLGLFCNTKKQVTIPQEFHFAIDERIPPPAKVVDLFDELSISSETSRDHQIRRNTKPSPFHLYTEERGVQKERNMWMELMQKQIEEEKARIPKAKPYPYTTDYPVIPPKPEPKHSTMPEPFQLESLVRHEEELQREMEERRRNKREEARMRIFKALPVLRELSHCRDPIPLPEKERKPLTQVQQFNLQLNHRCVERAEFDKKVKEKEMMYKRYRDEQEAAKMMEEEKALKQLRRTLGPHARPAPTFANPFVPQKSDRESTRAKSPKLRVRQRKEKQHTVGNAPVVSLNAAAAQMR